MKRRASIALAATLLAAGCDEGDRFSRVQLDTSPNCASAKIEVLIRDLNREQQPWSEVAQVVLDRRDPADFWALVRLRDEQGEPGEVAVVHVDDAQIDAQYEVFDILPEAQELMLRQSPFDQIVWLVERGPGAFRVTKFSIDDVGPNRERSSNLSWFPGTLANLCESEEPSDPFEEPMLGPCDVTDWHRDLAFLDRSPYIVSVPPFSPNATMFVYVGQLGDGFGVTEQTQLEFFRTCDDDDEDDSLPGVSPCAQELALTTYPSLDVMAEQRDSGMSTHHIFVGRTREVDRVPSRRELVAIALSAGSLPRGFVYSTAFEDVELGTGNPTSMALDRSSAYLLHPIVDGEAKVTRLRTGDSDLDRFNLLAPLDVDRIDAQMLQMRDDVALGWIDEGRWVVTKLFPDAPQRSEQVVYAPEAPVLEVRPAGAGAFLVLKDHVDGPDLVRLRCDED